MEYFTVTTIIRNYIRELNARFHSCRRGKPDRPAEVLNDFQSRTSLILWDEKGVTGKTYTKVLNPLFWFPKRLRSIYDLSIRYVLSADVSALSCSNRISLLMCKFHYLKQILKARLHLCISISTAVEMSLECTKKQIYRMQKRYNRRRVGTIVGSATFRKVVK